MLLTLPETGKTDILSMERPELERELTDLGQPKYRAAQIFSRLHKYTGGFETFTELPESLRAALDDKYAIADLQQVKSLKSSDGTIKLLLQTGDGNLIESVIMVYRHGLSLCLSVQAGCRMGCTFCASAHGGLIRSLAPSEMLLQVLRASEAASRRISNIVLMGTGEPLDNYDAVVCFIKLIRDSDSFNIGQRHISLSTCGLVDKIDELAKLRLGITLSISLHAPDDDLRMKLMPITRKWGVQEVVNAAKRYQTVTGRRVSYEYALIEDVNDGECHARSLAALLKNSGAHVNLIRLNETEFGLYKAASAEDAARFQAALVNMGVNATLRRKLGADISGACGQLRAEATNPDR